MQGAQVSVVSIPVSDPERSKAFYAERLGFQVALDNTFGEGMRWIMLRPAGGGAAITLVTWFSEMPPGSVQGTVLSVPDLEGAMRELKARGLDLDGAEVEEAPWGKWITIEDPDGNGWVVQQDAPFLGRQP